MSQDIKDSSLKQLGLNLKVLRLRAGLSQYEVAARLGIHPGRLSEIECGWRRPSPELLERLLELVQGDSDVNRSKD